MAESTKQLRPYINLTTLSLVIPDCETRPFTGEEWHKMVLPPCPKCGETITVGRIEVTTKENPVREYIFDRWQCPNECDPRQL